MGAKRSAALYPNIDIIALEDEKPAAPRRLAPIPRVLDKRRHNV
jgi:hypothetical protein